MWLLRVILFISIFGFLEAFAGPKSFGGKTYKHKIIVTEREQEDTDEDESVPARQGILVQLKLKTIIK